MCTGIKWMDAAGRPGTPAPTRDAQRGARRGWEGSKGMWTRGPIRSREQVPRSQKGLGGRKCVRVKRGVGDAGKYKLTLFYESRSM